ncbi:mechanosensitive ion channel domain-containing protein [Legionella jamestowniensis]|uniref:Small-conductance mechanosensitive channel n=1 Tax=Legionella jamestowniensis TaxID=455 RepID=A0A0W0UI25_9GAMM|nr:mechanosensitive ion channel domain-containing protein [Legionella jamestowniensis]KTD07538.1 mechanosensitive ion channel MscS [Legionella jamestowniensis]SFM01467.1 Small-conductance mechanosensitive channel [Legionella jamestowniensis DSM 19215]
MSLRLAIDPYKLVFLLSWICLITFVPVAFGAETIKSKPNQTISSPQPSEIPNKVEVKPLVRDTEISKRIEEILKATSWYQNPKVSVKDGVVFLKGRTKTKEYKTWAETLAHNTQDVVAVVNQIEIVGSSVWDFQKQLSASFKEQWKALIRNLPLFFLSLVVLMISWFVAKLIAATSRRALNARKLHPLLSNVIAHAVSFLFILFGVYIILRLLGLTTMAFTILGGTGIMGIILGIAFKNITENLLASILLSIQNPFHNEDLIEVAGVTGYVQGLTTRATVLMTPDGHLVQVPNAVVYQSNIYNYTSNPNRRENFIIGIGGNTSISKAQEVAVETLEKHPAILKDPEPLVLVDNILSGTVNLRIYFWLNSNKYNWQKVKSSAIRLVKSAFQEAEITMPGTEIELSFDKKTAKQLQAAKFSEKPVCEPIKPSKESTTVATHAEGGLQSDRNEIKKQAKRSKVIEKETNLLSSSKE